MDNNQLSGLFTNETNEKILKIKHKTEKEIKFDNLFSHSHENKVYVFTLDNSLYLLIQKNWNWFEKKCILKWREYFQFNSFIEQEEVMYRVIGNENPIYYICLNYFKKFKLYEVPFYVIPLIKELYKHQKYGVRKGNWEVIIDKSVFLRKNYLPFQIKEPKFKPRPYQSSAISQWHSNEEFGTISLATAGGKTIIAIQIIYNTQLNTLIAVPTETLIKQWQDDLIKLLSIPKNQIGLFYGKKKEIKAITIGTYNSLMKYIKFTDEEKVEIEESSKSIENIQKKIDRRNYLEDKLQNYFSLLIFDEAHHIPAPTFRNIALNSHALSRLSLSATVERFDGNESLLYFSAGKKVFELDYLSLCEEGWVVPFFYKYIPVYLSRDMEDKYIKLGSNLEMKRKISYFNNAKLANVIKICKTHVNNNHQILIFVYYVKDAKNIYNSLNELGLKCDVILSKKNQNKISNLSRDEVVLKFKNKEINITISTTVLDEGFNVPNASVGIICSGTSSERQMKQRIGRIVRRSEDPNKIGYIYEIVTEIEDNPSLDELNRLQRNNMIDNSTEYKKQKEILPPSCWLLNYEIINNYAYQKAKDRNIKII